MEKLAMTRKGSLWTFTAALAVSGLASTAHAQVSEARIRELIKQAADPNSRLQAPATVPPSNGDTRQVVPLSLDDAVKFALDRNLDIAVQRLNPEINDIAYASIKSVYHPSLTSLLSTQSTTAASTSTTSGGSAAGQPIIVGTTNYNGGLAQSIPWGGGSATVTLNNPKNTTTSLNT